MDRRIEEPDLGDDARGASRGTNILGVRAYNERLVLSLIRRGDQLSKAEVARRTGLSATAISAIMRKLEEDGLVTRQTPQRGRVGQPSVPFTLCAEGAYAFGLKVGRRSAELTLIDFLGGVVAARETTYKYPRPQGVLDFARAAAEAITSDIGAAARRRIVGFGVAMPSEIWNWSDLVGAPIGLAEWRDVDLERDLADALGWPARIVNDASAACAAELTFGASRPMRNFLYFFVGWFIGGGVALDGALRLGPNGEAGAVGSMLVNDLDGKQRQLIETSSLLSLEREIVRRGGAQDFLWREDSDWSEYPEALAVWIDRAAYGMAQAAANAAALLDLDGVVIDGAMPPQVRERLFSATQDHFDGLDRRGVHPFAFAEGRVGRKARSIGAASLPLIADYAANPDVMFKL